MTILIKLDGYYEAGPSYLYGWSLTKLIKHPLGWKFLDVAFRHPDTTPAAVYPFVEFAGDHGREL